jgi:hypothetical protein
MLSEFGKIWDDNAMDGTDALTAPQNKDDGKHHDQDQE